jgi:hypothetical protein
MNIFRSVCSFRLAASQHWSGHFQAKCVIIQIIDHSRIYSSFLRYVDALPRWRGSSKFEFVVVH